MARSRFDVNDEVIHFAIRISLLALLVYWTFVLVQPFLAILAWSVILTVALYPAYERLARALGGRRVLAAVLVTVASLAIVIGPATWFAVSLVDGLRTISDSVSSAEITVPRPPTWIKEWPLVGGPFYEFWSLASTNIASALAELGPQVKAVAKPLLGVASSVGEGMLKFLLAVVVMGFLLLPGPRIVEGVRALLTHVIADRDDEYLKLTAATIRSISLGVLGVSLLQALLAGIGFAMAQVPGASVLTFFVLLLAIVQIGAAIVMLGVLVWAWTTMDSTAALILTLYLVPVGLLDNILKPFIMGHGLKTPMPVILVGLLGGTIAHGVIGLFLGPIVLAVAWQLMLAWMRDNTSKVPTDGPVHERVGL
ncbi:MAG: AI-2E family transporter [Bradyrhizobium sp.]|nr:AI-2E family transporter [Bradyrhizobium sp.]